MLTVTGVFELPAVYCACCILQQNTSNCVYPNLRFGMVLGLFAKTTEKSGCLVPRACPSVRWSTWNSTTPGRISESSIFRIFTNRLSTQVISVYNRQWQNLREQLRTIVNFMVIKVKLSLCWLMLVWSMTRQLQWARASSLLRFRDQDR